jgi:hypothetical protein
MCVLTTMLCKGRIDRSRWARASANRRDDSRKMGQSRRAWGTRALLHNMNIHIHTHTHTHTHMYIRRQMSGVAPGNYIDVPSDSRSSTSSIKPSTTSGEDTQRGCKCSLYVTMVIDVWQRSLRPWSQPF